MVQIALGAFSDDKDASGTQIVSLWNDTTVWTEDFLGKVGTQPSLVAWYQHWGGATAAWNTNRIEVLTARGEVPVITWEAWDPSLSATNNTAYHLSTILAGNHNAYIDDWGTKAAAYGKPILIRLFHEFNLAIYPWCIGVVSQTAANVVSAWQYVVDRVRAKGATNVKWVWCPLAEGSFPVSAAYPGDSYVDYLGLDGYNNIPSDGGWQTPADVFDSAYASVTSVSTKPFFFNEVGCMETGGDKAAWMTDFFNRCQTNYPRTRGICWFDTNKESDWRVNSSVGALASWNNVADNPEYRGNIETGVQFVRHTETKSATAVASLTANVPTSIANDILIMSVASGGIADTNIDTGTWTKFGEKTDLNTTNSGTSRLNLYWRRSIGASEPTTVGLSATGGGTRVWDVDIQVWRGCKTSGDPFETVSMYGESVTGMTGTISLPSVLTTDPDRRVVSNVYFRDGTTAALAGLSWNLAYIEEVEATTQVASSNSQTLGIAHSFVPGEETTTPQVTLTNAQNTYVAATFALIPAPVGLVVPTLTETLRPTAVSGVTGLTPTDSASATALIDDDPDDTAPTDWMTGTDPSGSTTTHGVQEPTNTIPNATGLTATTWANPANIADTSDTTVASVASLATANTDYGGYFAYEAADFTGIPSTATITGISLAARMRGGTAGRINAYLQLATANGSLIGSEVAVNNGTALGNALTTFTYTHTSFARTPTRSELVTGTFGVRLRIRRGSQTSTFEVARLAMTVTYTLPGTTTPISVTVAMGNPTRTLKKNTTVNGQMRAKLRKKGNGAAPPVTIELREAGVLRATVVNAQSVTSTTSQIFSADFDQNLIVNPNDVEFRITSPGVAGALVEVGAIEWVAEVSGTIYLLSWDPSTEADLAGYNAYRSTTLNGTYTKINTSLITIADYFDTNVVEGQSYYWKITAVDTANNESAQSTAATVPSGGSRTITDPVGIVDSVTVTRVIARGITDTGATADSSVRAFARQINELGAISDAAARSRTRIALDAEPLSDGYSRTLGRSRLTLEALGLSEVFARTLQRRLSDTASAVDPAPSKVQSFFRTQSSTGATADLVRKGFGKRIEDVGAIGDTISSTRALSRLLSDPSSISDVATRTRARTMLEAAAVVDAYSKTQAYSRGASSTLPLLEAISRSRSRGAVDVVGAADYHVAIRSFVKLLSDLISTSDALTRSRARATLDPISGVDAYAKAQGHVATRNDAASIADSLIRARARAIIEAALLADAHNRVVAVSRSSLDTMAALDSLTRAMTRSSTDTISGVDAQSSVQTFSRVAMELVSAQDAYAKTQGFYRQPAVDAISASDSYTLLGGILLTKSDALSVADAHYKLQGHNRSLTEEAVSLLDSASKTQAFSRNTQDTAALLDALTRDRTRTTRDTGSASDSVSIIKTLSKSALDTLLTLDARIVTQGHARTPTELLSLVDAFSKAQAANRAIGDIVSVADLYSPYKSGQIERVSLDELSMGDSVLKAQGISRLNLDVALALDLHSSFKFADYTRQLLDELETQDLPPEAVTDLVLALSDAVAVAESVDRAQAQHRYTLEDLALVEVFLARLVGATFEVPPTRFSDVPLETRSSAVPQETRYADVALETRYAEVPRETRHADVPAETRNATSA